MNFLHVSEIIPTIIKTDSPIESIMVGVLQYFKLRPKTQVKIGKYRVDILLETKYKNIIIECDGKEFHQDLKREEARDKYLRDKGYTVLHFTGSRIATDRIGCAHEVIEEISEIYGSKEYQRYLEDYINAISKAVEERQKEKEEEYGVYPNV